MKRYGIMKIAVLSTVVALPAYTMAAEDAKSYPGSMCQPETASDASDLIYYTSRVLNKDTHTHYVELTCPIVKDKLALSAGLKNITVFYRNEYGTFTLPFEFILRSFNPEGTGYYSKSSKPDAVEGSHSLNMGSINGFAFGYYALHVKLPPRGSIVSYQVTEK